MAKSFDEADGQYIRYLEQQLAEIELKLVDARKGGFDEALDLRELLSTREEVIQTQSAELRELRSGLAPARLQEVHNLRKALASSKHGLESCQSALARQKAEAVQSESVSTASLAAVRSDLVSQKAQTAAHEQKLHQAEASMRVAASRMQDLQHQNSELEAECSRLAEALSRCVSSLERLREHSQASDAAAQGRQSATHAQEQRMESLRRDMRHGEQEREKLQALLQAGNDKLAALKAQLFDEQEKRQADQQLVQQATALVCACVAIVPQSCESPAFEFAGGESTACRGTTC